MASFQLPELLLSDCCALYGLLIRHTRRCWHLRKRVQHENRLSPTGLPYMWRGWRSTRSLLIHFLRSVRFTLGVGFFSQTHLLQFLSLAEMRLNTNKDQMSRQNEEGTLYWFPEVDTGHVCSDKGRRGLKSRLPLALFMPDTDLVEITGHKVALDRCRQPPREKERCGGDIFSEGLQAQLRGCRAGQVTLRTNRNVGSHGRMVGDHTTQRRGKVSTVGTQNTGEVHRDRLCRKKFLKLPYSFALNCNLICTDIFKGINCPGDSERASLKTWFLIKKV